MESNLRVILLEYTPNPEALVAMAAKLCYSSSDIDSLKEKTAAKDQKKFVEKLMEIGHMSPIEHASFTFAVEGISRACSHQLVRHRLASYSQQSQRYVSEEEGFDFVIPPSIKKDRELARYYEDFMNKAQAAYNHIVRRLNEKGLKDEEANQDARFILPNACETKIIITMNARELLHFFTQRCCNRAQWEIRSMAIEMFRLVSGTAPTVFRHAGPGCLKGKCPEGDYTCGKMKEVREFFKKVQVVQTSHRRPHGT